jgi:hypothetical protein
MKNLKFILASLFAVAMFAACDTNEPVDPTPSVPAELSIDDNYVQVKAEGYQEYATLIEVVPKNFATAGVVADLVPVSSGTGVPTTGGTSGVPPAPTKSPVCAVLPVIALFGAWAVLRR